MQEHLLTFWIHILSSLAKNTLVSKHGDIQAVALSCGSKIAEPQAQVEATCSATATPALCSATFRKSMAISALPQPLQWEDMCLAAASPDASAKVNDDRRQSEGHQQVCCSLRSPDACLLLACWLPACFLLLHTCCLLLVACWLQAGCHLLVICQLPAGCLPVSAGYLLVICWLLAAGLLVTSWLRAGYLLLTRR
jgi:hypothetical protein